MSDIETVVVTRKNQNKTILAHELGVYLQLGWQETSTTPETTVEVCSVCMSTICECDSEYPTQTLEQHTETQQDPAEHSASATLKPVKRRK